MMGMEGNTAWQREADDSNNQDGGGGGEEREKKESLVCKAKTCL